MLLRPAPVGARRSARGAALRHRGGGCARRSQPHRALSASAEDDADAADAAAPAAMRKVRRSRDAPHVHARSDLAPSLPPQRRLIVLRHAAAEPRSAPEADVARALSARGKRDARAVAR